MPSALESAFLALVASRRVRLEDLPQLFRSHGVAPEDLDAILSSGAERLLTYRTRTRANLEGLIRAVLPRTASRLGGRFEADFGEFLAEAAPRSEYLRAVVRDFIDHAAPRWRADRGVPPFVADLAEHEALHLEIGAAPRSAPADALPELNLDAPVRFIEASRLVRYAHAVHELPADADDRSEPPRKDVSLFVYRDAFHDIRYLELTPLAAELLAHLHERRQLLGAAVLETCRAHGVQPAAILTGASHLLADLAARGALLGTEPAPPAVTPTPSGQSVRCSREALE